MATTVGRQDLPGLGPAASLAQDLPCGSVFAELGSSVRGLSEPEAVARLSRWGPNELPQPRRRPLWLRFAAQFTDLFAVVLLVAAAVTFLAYLLSHPPDLGSLQLSLAILAVVLLNAVIGFIQEYSAERTAQALQAMVPRRCRVLRAGVRVEVPARVLVPGDVVLLEAGDAVPADCRVVEAHELSVNNAALTGESMPVARTADPMPGSRRTEARNLVFMGTSIATGTGKAVVVLTGAGTEFGRIVRLTLQAAPQRSPLQRQVASMARRVSAVALSVGALVFAARLPTGQPVVDSFVFALGVMVALVPEGLPATLSVALAIGVRRMARQHALVRRLLSVEALGSATVVCTDKTGTLTQAEMTVTGIWDGQVSHAVSGVGYAPQGQVDDPGPVTELLRVAALCCNARLLPPGPKQGWRVLGDTTEGALLVAAAKAGLDLGEQERLTPRIGEFPFDSGRKLMSTLHRDPRTGGVELYVKGALQEVLARCTRLRGPSGDQDLDQTTRAAVTAANDAMASAGLRVLAVASRRLPAPDLPQRAAEADLTLHGLVGMQDPPRPEVTAAISACRRAGLRIIMVTGDHPLTAEAVARRVGLVTGGPPQVITGAELTGMDDDELDRVLATSRESLFCRVSPEHKMRVVAALKRAGQVVAVTGDGANDAPALKRADIGVAMGRSGTDVAREAADLVLLDDSFASIVTAVELGRSVYQNIRKFLIYLFSHNIAELVPILVATAAGFPLVPLTAVQVLAIDLGSDVLPALALGVEPPEPDVMDRPPRSPREPLFSLEVAKRFLFLGTIQSIGVCVAFFWRIHSAGIPLSQLTTSSPVYREAITMTQAGIVVSQFFNGFTVRSNRHSVLTLGLWSNPALVLAECLGIGLMASISYLPPLQNLFHTGPLSVQDWLLLILFGLLLLAADETRKAINRRRGPAPNPGTTDRTRAAAPGPARRSETR